MSQDQDDQQALERRMHAAVVPLAAAVASLDAELMASVSSARAEIERDPDGKYLKLAVPDFEADATVPSGSYLRLGALDADSRQRIASFLSETELAETPPDPAAAFPPDTGDDLALRVRAFAADDWPQCAEGHDPEVPGVPPAYAPGYDTPEARAARSAQLHLAGGWREHTDGNRITTTRGDKVEVIGGNYKLLVLCRDDQSSSEAGFDVSAGHVEGATSTLGNRRARTAGGHAGARTESGSAPADADVDVRWVERSDGTWQTVETAQKGDSHVIQHGDADTLMFGHVHHSVTGAVGATPWHEPEDCNQPDECLANPKVIDRTWAESIHSYSGSDRWHIPRMSNTTDALQMNTVSRVGAMRDVTTADTMLSGMVIDEVFTDVTECGSMRTVVSAGVYMDVTRCGLMTSSTVGNMFDMTLAPAYLTLTAGMSQSTTLGATTSLMIGTSTDITLGASLSVSVGASLDIMLGSSVSASHGAKLELSLTHNEVTAAADSENALGYSVKSLLIMIGLP